jgi:prevent-host-death family protein
MTISTKRQSKSATWPVAKAKARLSAVIDQALTEGPQTITRSGRKAVIVVSAEDWERKSHRQGNLAEFLASSPLRGSGVRIKRAKEPSRRVHL